MEKQNIYNAAKLKELQALPLDEKIRLSNNRIIEWDVYFDDNTFVSLSGGKDSRVLLHLVRRLYPNTPAVFSNTGLEFPEIRQFANSFDNVTEVHPVWGRLGKAHGHLPTDQFSFRDVISLYGYPIISKEVANAIENARQNPNGSRAKRMRGGYQRRDGKGSMYDYSNYLPLMDLPVRFSAYCCNVMKKGPLHAYQKRTGRAAFVGTMAYESMLRRSAWLVSGCNAYDNSSPVSKPLSFWTNQDILQYCYEFNLEICSVYGELKKTVLPPPPPKRKYIRKNPPPGEPAQKPPPPNVPTVHYSCTGCQRTGCVYCAFGLHKEIGETRFQSLAKTHPKLYEYSIEGGEWSANPKYDATLSNKDIWNPKEIWTPNQKGLGMGKVFDMVNEIYGNDFLRYK